MYCVKCGALNEDGALFCRWCGNSFTPEPTQNAGQAYGQTAYQQPYTQPAVADNSKLYAILSYIGILWLFGLLINPERQKPYVRHHVGQGIILSIFAAGGYVVASILTTMLFSIFSFGIFSFGYASVSPAPVVIGALLWISAIGFHIFLVVDGIIKAAAGKTEPLPVIGKLAFYK